MDFRLNPNQSENGKYNLILGWFNKISNRILCVYGLTGARNRVFNEVFVESDELVIAFQVQTVSVYKNRISSRHTST